MNLTKKIMQKGHKESLVSADSSQADNFKPAKDVEMLSESTTESSAEHAPEPKSRISFKKAALIVLMLSAGLLGCRMLFAKTDPISSEGQSPLL